LFGRAEKAPELLRRAELWNWLTPVAACCMAMLVALGGASYRAAHFDEAEDATVVAAVMLSGASSNLQPTLPVGQMDQNIQWNLWTRISTPRVTNLSEASAGLERWRAIATNR
jgi:hypothetical protein